MAEAAATRYPTGHESARLSSGSGWAFHPVSTVRTVASVQGAHEGGRQALHRAVASAHQGRSNFDGAERFFIRFAENGSNVVMTFMELSCPR